MTITYSSPDDTYNADMIDRRIFIEPYDDDVFNRFFRKKDLKKLYRLFLEQVIPIAKEIMDISHYPNDESDYEFFVGSNNFIPERYCIHGHIQQTFLWYMIWSTEDNNNLSTDRSNMVRHFNYFLVHHCMNNILERAYDMYVGVFDTKIDVSFFIDHLRHVTNLRFEDISQEYDNFINFWFR
ncbi:37187_t:CDS:2 [Gigaspora margarita]|uniref:37187_t:CDS:1 n=1 Tax=Gigaspora margarita TaxID=4874 RepID=A0ABN7VKK8_GIGMA|nr:37187_t:CDS:2 [Gigaspora margarita]